MCGIVGIATVDGGVSESLVSRMRDRMTHRGPDDAGTWVSSDGTLGLGHRRLSIIDLSPSGHQPMTDGGGTLRIVFNGEIYNYLALREELRGLGHRFTSSSDTEVILEAYREWGLGCVARLNGMFALALYDREKERLLLARDRAGEKPLFYSTGGRSLVFASELKSLMEAPGFVRRMDPDALNAYLAFGYVPAPHSLLAGVRKLEPGHLAVYDLKARSLRTEAYWTLPRSSGAPFRSEEQLVEELGELLLDSVRMRLIADVPVGVMLSGGVDSSLVTAMAAKVSSRPVRTFTISFPGHAAHDEAPHAKLVADYFGTEHTALVAEAATVDLLPVLAKQYDEPLADSSMVPTYLVSRLIRQHATVALGGDGGDELFAGYHHYDWVHRQVAMRRIVPRPVRALAGAAGAVLPYGARGRNFLIAAGGGIHRGIALANVLFHRRSRAALLRPSGIAATLRPEQEKALLADTTQTPLYQATAVDFRTYMVDDILVKVDRASMLTSLEVRAPFLDPRIIELAFRDTPDSLKAADGGRKILLRKLAARVLPKELDIQRKQGFAIPFDQWFRGEWGRFIESVLLDRAASWMDQRIIRDLIRGQQRGRSNTPRLFALLMLELWRREYAVGI